MNFPGESAEEKVKSHRSQSTAAWEKLIASSEAVIFFADSEDERCVEACNAGSRLAASINRPKNKLICIP